MRTVTYLGPRGNFAARTNDGLVDLPAGVPVEVDNETAEGLSDTAGHEFTIEGAAAPTVLDDETGFDPADTTTGDD